jgi:CBS domain-containing protein
VRLTGATKQHVVFGTQPAPLAPAAFQSDDSHHLGATWRHRGDEIGTSTADGGSAMTVKAILANKGPDVVTIDPTATLADAAKLLAQHRIGAALVLGIEGRVAGILSERDIVRALAERGAAVLTERVDQVMTRKVITCGEGDTVAQVMEQMTGGKFRHLPVVEQGKLIGIVSIGDIVKHRLHEIESESNALREYILTA